LNDTVEERTTLKTGRMRMSNRREFLKEAATGAVLVGAQSKLGLAAILDRPMGGGKPKVVIARDPAVHGPDGQLDEKHVLDLLDRAIASYTGRDHPIEAWCLPFVSACSRPA
jgi:hypothetical protein